MREDYGSLNLVTHDDGFGDMGFDTDNPDIMREAIGNEDGLEQVICFSYSYSFILCAIFLEITMDNVLAKSIRKFVCLAIYMCLFKKLYLYH